MRNEGQKGGCNHRRRDDRESGGGGGGGATNHHGAHVVDAEAVLSVCRCLDSDGNGRLCGKAVGFCGRWKGSGQPTDWMDFALPKGEGNRRIPLNDANADTNMENSGNVKYE